MQKRLTDPSERARVAADLARRYADGASVRAISIATRRAYGTVHQLLLEGGVTMRSRGGGRSRG